MAVRCRDGAPSARHNDRRRCCRPPPGQAPAQPSGWLGRGRREQPPRWLGPEPGLGGPAGRQSTTRLCAPEHTRPTPPAAASHCTAGVRLAAGSVSATASGGARGTFGGDMQVHHHRPPQSLRGAGMGGQKGIVLRLPLHHASGEQLEVVTGGRSRVGLPKAPVVRLCGRSGRWTVSRTRRAFFRRRAK